MRIDGDVDVGAYAAWWRNAGDHQSSTATLKMLMRRKTVSITDSMVAPAFDDEPTLTSAVDGNQHGDVGISEELRVDQRMRLWCQRTVSNR